MYLEVLVTKFFLSLLLTLFCFTTLSADHAPQTAFSPYTAEIESITYEYFSPTALTAHIHVKTLQGKLVFTLQTRKHTDIETWKEGQRLNVLSSQRQWNTSPMFHNFPLVVLANQDVKGRPVSAIITPQSLERLPTIASIEVQRTRYIPYGPQALQKWFSKISEVILHLSDGTSFIVGTLEPEISTNPEEDFHRLSLYEDMNQESLAATKYWKKGDHVLVSGLSEEDGSFADSAYTSTASAPLAHNGVLLINLDRPRSYTNRTYELNDGWDFRVAAGLAAH